MKKLAPYLFCLFCSGVIVAQVGIGTTNPTALLEILGTNTGIPVLELNPQSNPIGSDTGQLAVIGNSLCMYDATRSKWLSVEGTAYEWVYEDIDINNELLTIAGDYANKAHLVANVMPLDGTIVYASINYTQVSGATANTFDIYLEDPDGTAVATLNTNSSKTVLTALNIDFNSSDRLFVEYMGPGTIIDPVVVLWVKWRE